MRWSKSLIVGAAAVVAVALPGSPAAAVESNVTMQQNTGINSLGYGQHPCLGLNGGGDLVIVSCQNADTVKWDALGDGTIRLANDHNRCLDSSKSGRAYVLPCNGGDYQEWWRRGTSNPWLVQDDATSLCLDGSNGGVYTSPCAWDNPYEQWFFVE